MKIIVCDTYEHMSAKIADDLISKMKSDTPLLCTASGETPTGIYRELVSRKIGTDWKFIGLDEWVGMDAEKYGSCRHYIDEHLFRPLQIPEDRIFFFNGKAQDLDDECNKAEKFIRLNNGIDAAILGVGMNGHVGLNEPGVSPDLRVHVMKVDQMTAATGQKYFKEKTDLHQGITLGIAALMEVKYPYLIISGKHKAAIAKKILEEQISKNRPASLLRNHKQLTVYLDKDAASMLTHEE